MESSDISEFLISVGYAPEDVKTHSSVIGQFGLRMNKTGLVSRDVGKALNDVQEIRQLADYLPATVPEDKAKWAVDQARLFVDTVYALPDIRSALS